MKKQVASCRPVITSRSTQKLAALTARRKAAAADAAARSRQVRTAADRDDEDPQRLPDTAEQLQ